MKKLIIISLIICSCSTHKFDNINYMRDYQIECTQDSMFIMDGHKVVGIIPYDSSKFSQVILNDNR